MKHLLFIFLSLFILLLAGCQNNPQACPVPTGPPQYLTVPPEKLTASPANGPGEVKIGWQTISVDKIVEGPLCNDTWSGTVYVGCNVQVYPWQEEPTFLKDCQLNITSGTIVYVAYHNNAAYYNGCSCHTGATPEP